MAEFEIAEWQDAGSGQSVAWLAQRQWLAAFRLLSAGDEPVEVRTADDEESGLIVLSGTHDLEAASGSWPARGLRETPFEGRPVALFLPPKTPFRASGGRGELLLVSARRPPEPAVAEPESAHKPLLPLAGSNKAFDGKTGTWRPIESFPDSAEAILPRRIERCERGGVPVERVFPPEYKTAGLGLLEAVLQPGQHLRLPGAERVLDYPAEWAVFCRGEGTVELSGHPFDAGGVAAGTGDAQLVALEGRCYLVAAFSGPKPA